MGPAGAGGKEEKAGKPEGEHSRGRGGGGGGGGGGKTCFLLHPQATCIARHSRCSIRFGFVLLISRPHPQHREVPRQEVESGAVAAGLHHSHSKARSLTH